MSKLIAKPTAVLFDLDNTLYAYAPAHDAALAAVALKINRQLGIAEREFKDAFAFARKEIHTRLGATASSHSRLLYFQRVIEILGLKTQPLLSLDLEQTYWRSFLSKARIFEGVRKLLDELHLLGIPKAIVTDLAAQIQFRKLVYFQLDSHFDAVVSSEEAGADKPSGLIFSLALEKLGVKKGGVWMIGDDHEKDMIGAKKSINAVTFLKKEKSFLPSSLPECVDYTFDDFSTLTEKLGLYDDNRTKKMLGKAV